MCGYPPLTLSFIAVKGNLIGLAKGLANPPYLIHLLCSPSLRVGSVDGKAMQIQLNGTLRVDGDGGCGATGIGHDDRDSARGSEVYLQRKVADECTP